MSDGQNPSQAQNAKKLFVGNLPWSIRDESLEELFAEFGEIVSANVITDRMTGRSKGFGFVEFADEAAAQAAVDKMNDFEVEGRGLVVNIARPKAPRRDGDRGGYRGGNRGGYDRSPRRDY